MKKLLVLSDNPNGTSGLGHIAKDIVDRTDLFMENVDVGVIGVGGTTSRHTPYPVYPVALGPNYEVANLPGIVQDFCGDEDFVLFTILNAAWQRWLAMPELLPDSGLKSFLQTRKFEKWGYFPVDAYGPNEKLMHTETSIIGRFDRILAYTWFGADVIGRSIGKPIEYLPHGTDEHAFYPMPKENVRRVEFGRQILGKQVSLDPGIFLIGVVATNTARKDWGLAFATAAELAKRGKKVGLWCHVERPVGYWDLLTMAKEFGIQSNVLITTNNLSNTNLAWGYAACDVTLGIGSGEGWGMTMAESLACGVPVITGDYAGATEFVPPDFRVKPIAFHYDGLFCAQRPVYSPQDFADAALNASGSTVSLDPKFYWGGENGAWEQWKAWIEKGL